MSLFISTLAHYSRYCQWLEPSKWHFCFLTFFLFYFRFYFSIVRMDTSIKLINLFCNLCIIFSANKRNFIGWCEKIYKRPPIMIIDNIIIHLVSQKYSSEYLHASIKCYTSNSKYLPRNLTSSIFASRHSFEYKFLWMKIYQRIRHVKTRIDVTFHIKENWVLGLR